MEMVENKDYRMLGSVAYFRLCYRDNYFIPGTEEQIVIDKIRYERRCWIKFADDNFIKTGKENSPFYRTPYTL